LLSGEATLRQTTKSLKTAPTASVGVTLPTTTGGAWSAWVEVIAVAADDLDIAGFHLYHSAPMGATDIQVGVGAAAAEVSVFDYNWHGENPGNVPGGRDLIPMPVTGKIPAGSRVCLRGRSSVNANIYAVFCYYESLDSDHSTAQNMGTVPADYAGANTGTEVPPPAVAWTWSGWVELSSGLPSAVEFAGIMIESDTSVGIKEFEFEYGLGAAAAEVPLTRIRRSTFGTSPQNPVWWLHTPIAVPASTRISVRVRQSGTTTGSAALGQPGWVIHRRWIYYNPTAPPQRKHNYIFGLTTKIRGVVRGFAIGLNGAVNELIEEGKFKVFGKGEFTESLEVITPTADNHAVTKLYCDSQVPVIADDSITNAKLSNMAQATLKGRASGAGTGDPTDLTPDQASTILDGATVPFLRTSALASLNKRLIVMIIDGGGSVISTGVQGFSPPSPFAGTITKVELFSCDPAVLTGSIVLDIWKDTYANFPPTNADSITAAAQPTITANVKSSDAVLTGWTTAVAVGDIFGYTVDSVSTFKRVMVVMSVTI
jgi:hypothetical protein